MSLVVVYADIADREVDAIVNAWNRNFIPPWLLVPQGVSRSLRQKGGRAIFAEVARHGLLPLGAVVATGAGRLRARWVLHAAVLHAYWRASPGSVATAAANAIALAARLGARSMAIPLLGAGTGGVDPAVSFERIRTAWTEAPARPDRVEVVVQQKPNARKTYSPD